MSPTPSHPVPSSVLDGGLPPRAAVEHGFLARMTALTRSWWESLIAAAPVETLGHREAMRVIAGGVAINLAGGREPDPARLRVLDAMALRLQQLQGTDGLFSSDGNLHSPPDSSFTLNDLAITLALLDGASAGYDGLRSSLREIGRAAMPALVTGGVHTPNHRWEISAALVRLASLDERAIPRAQQWLAEGVDVDADGLYSERSANYASLVTNPSLLVLADALGRPDLAQVVHTDLHTQLVLTDADGLVETVFSRRQDQRTAIPLELFHTQLRRFALDGCAVCAAGALRSEPSTGRHAVTALLETLSHPALGAEVEPHALTSSSFMRHLAGVGLLVTERGRVRTVVYGGSDVPTVGRVGSGLAGNPTFLRFRNGAAVVRSLRLSRTFFGLGPFRSEGLEVDDDGVARLAERVSARYHQPLPAAALRSDGDYRLEPEGRFWSAMAFSERAGTEVELSTEIVATPLANGALAVRVEQHGDAAPWSLEIALGDGVIAGAREVATDVFTPTGTRVGLRHGGDALAIDVDDAPEQTSVGWYDPGEAYTFLGGTDALSGRRLYLTGRAPGTLSLTLRPL